MLDVLEYRWDWASFGFTVELFKYVFLNFIPDVIFHTQAQDEEQIRDNYDRTSFPSSFSSSCAHHHLY